MRKSLLPRIPQVSGKNQEPEEYTPPLAEQKHYYASPGKA